MANLIRSAKSGRDWTQAELDAYNIIIVPQNATTFFGTNHLPDARVDEEILNNIDAQNMISDRNAELIHLLDLAMLALPYASSDLEESAVVDFAVELFKMLGYVKRNRVARTRKDIPLIICGEIRRAKTDVCIIDRDQNGILLLVQEDRRYGSGDVAVVDAQAQLIAKAIGTFGYNNRYRAPAGLPPLDEQVIPGIVMSGTTPTFYKIRVSSDLEFAVRHGLFPPRQTQVFVHYPRVPRPRRLSDGMRPLDSRREILKCYEAFKTVIGF